jgi:ABC-type transport system substrate-binding protein
LRDALALSIDRAALNNVVLQGGGESSAALLPNWMTGYGFVFPSEANLAHARQEVAEYRQKKPWTVSYDAADPIAKVVADRIVLNARDAGVILQLTTSNADLRLVRAPIGSSDPHVALAGIAEVLKLPRPKFTGNSIDDLYKAESSLLQSRQVIPLLHLRIQFELRPTLRGWDEAPDGSWNLGNVWLFPEKSGTEQR